MLLPDAKNQVAEGLVTTLTGRSTGQILELPVRVRPCPPDSDMDKNKIIFLDCDGVLNRLGGGTGDLRYFTPECFQAFQTIIFSTQAKVVLSTSWREFSDWENMLRDWFGAIGIEIIGKTPISKTGDRAVEIRDYLAEHANEIENYVVLDDFDLRADFPGHCVCACASDRIGLDLEWAAEAIDILKKGDRHEETTDLSSSGACGVDSGEDC